MGLPGWMWIRLILRSSAQPSMRLDVNSGPLSERTLSGLASSLDQPLQFPCHTTAPQAGISLQHQALAGERIDHAEDADHAAVRQPIHEEVHRPLLVRPEQTRLDQLFAHQPFAPRPAHGPPLLNIQPIDSLHVHRLSATLQHRMQPSISIARLLASQLYQLIA